MSKNPRLMPPTTSQFNHAQGKSLLPIKFKSNTISKGLGYDKTNKVRNLRLIPIEMG
jgi:hypothetical protein